MRAIEGPIFISKFLKTIDSLCSHFHLYPGTIEPVLRYLRIRRSRIQSQDADVHDIGSTGG